MSDLVDDDVRNELIEAEARRLPFSDDRPPIERYLFGQGPGVLDALVIERDAFVETAELHRVPKADASRSIRVGHFLDPENDIAETLSERRRQPVERAPSDHLDLGGAGVSAMEALGFWGGSVTEAMRAVGIDHLAAVPVRLLSSGQAKRAALARVAASDALLWLLDEPLNALDADGGERVSGLVAAHLASGGAILAASHQPLPGDWRLLELGR